MLPKQCLSEGDVVCSVFALRCLHYLKAYLSVEVLKAHQMPGGQDDLVDQPPGTPSTWVEHEDNHIYVGDSLKLS